MAATTPWSSEGRCEGCGNLCCSCDEFLAEARWWMRVTFVADPIERAETLQQMLMRPGEPLTDLAPAVDLVEDLEQLAGRVETDAVWAPAFRAMLAQWRAWLTPATAGAKPSATTDAWELRAAG